MAKTLIALPTSIFKRLKAANLTKVAHNLTWSVRHSIKEQNIKGLLASSRDRIIDTNERD